jgi:predicted DNA-binding transcriptional regulator YafY
MSYSYDKNELMRAQRLLSILMQLQVNRRMTARELAQKLEVSERTILRDMDALSSSGVPVIAERGAGGGWSLLAEYETKLTGLSPAEIQSLFISRAPKLAADLGLQQASEGAWTKLQAALPPTARRQADDMRQRVLIDPRGWRNPAESASSLPVLLDALWRERQVRFLYEGLLNAAGERIVDPLGLVARGSTWYLIANRDSELRTYRVSRMRNAETLETAARRPADFDIAAYWERSATEFREKLPQFRATFLAKPSVMQWIRYRGWRLEEETPEGALVRVRLRFDVEVEALQFALSFGADVEVVDPAELRGQVREAALAMLGLYGGNL